MYNSNHIKIVSGFIGLDCDKITILLLLKTSGTTEAIIDTFLIGTVHKLQINKWQNKSSSVEYSNG